MGVSRGPDSSASTGRSAARCLTAWRPGPPRTPACCSWYRETSADLLRLGSLAEAVEHLPRARRIFPSDPEIMFASGVLHERFSSPALQAAAESVRRQRARRNQSELG